MTKESSCKLAPCKQCGHEAKLMVSEKHDMCRVICDNDVTECPYIQAAYASDAQKISGLWNAMNAPTNEVSMRERRLVEAAQFALDYFEGKMLGSMAKDNWEDCSRLLREALTNEGDAP